MIVDPTPRRRRRLPWLFWLSLIPLLLWLRHIDLYWRDLTASMALSDACDQVTMAVNDTVRSKLSETSPGSFVSLERDTDGHVTAISTDVARINRFAADVLAEVVDASARGELDIRVPLGTLLGSNWTLGRGPEVPVDILMLTSSHADFHAQLLSAGINQTRHQIVLELVVDVDILVPWQTLSTQVICRTPIAETVIVGQVPDTYIQ